MSRRKQLSCTATEFFHTCLAVVGDPPTKLLVDSYNATVSAGYPNNRTFFAENFWGQQFMAVLVAKGEAKVRVYPWFCAYNRWWAAQKIGNSFRLPYGLQSYAQPEEQP